MDVNVDRDDDDCFPPDTSVSCLRQACSHQPVKDDPFRDSTRLGHSAMPAMNFMFYCESNLRKPYIYWVYAATPVTVGRGQLSIQRQVAVFGHEFNHPILTGLIGGNASSCQCPCSPLCPAAWSDATQLDSHNNCRAPLNLENPTLFSPTHERSFSMPWRTLTKDKNEEKDEE